MQILIIYNSRNCKFWNADGCDCETMQNATIFTIEHFAKDEMEHLGEDYILLTMQIELSQFAKV